MKSKQLYLVCDRFLFSRHHRSKVVVFSPKFLCNIKNNDCEIYRRLTIVSCSFNSQSQMIFLDKLSPAGCLDKIKMQRRKSTLCLRTS